MHSTAGKLLIGVFSVLGWDTDTGAGWDIGGRWLKDVSGWLLVCTLYLPWTRRILAQVIHQLPQPAEAVSISAKSLPTLMATSTPCSSTTDAKVIHVESHPTVSAMQTQAIYHGAEMPDTTSPSGAGTQQRFGPNKSGEVASWGAIAHSFRRLKPDHFQGFTHARLTAASVHKNCMPESGLLSLTCCTLLLSRIMCCAKSL